MFPALFMLFLLDYLTCLCYCTLPFELLPEEPPPEPSVLRDPNPPLLGLIIYWFCYCIFARAGGLKDVI